MNTCPRCKVSYPNDVTACPKDGEPLAPGEDLEAGTMVGEYRVEKKLGEGGFGAVYLAVHHVINKSVAIKILNRACSMDPAMLSRFTSEARVVNQIRHRNIVDIFAFGRLPDGRHYHVMELLEGKPFDEYLKERGRISLEEALPIFRGVSRALGAAHTAGVVHRDLKPANVFLVRDEDVGFAPKLIDFGIAKLDDENAAHKTKTGAMMGTAHYMSPEQCRGRGVDARTDIYAFGAMIHVALTGRKPFEGESVMDVIMKQITDPPPPMSASWSGIAKELDEPVLRMLEKDPSKRPQTIAEAFALLEASAKLAGVVAAGPNSALGQEGAVIGRTAASNSQASSASQASPPSQRESVSQSNGSITNQGVEQPTLVDKPPRSRRTALIAFGCLVAAILGYLITIPLLGSSRAPEAGAPGDGAKTFGTTSSSAVVPVVTPATVVPSATASNSANVVSVSSAEPKNTAIKSSAGATGQAKSQSSSGATAGPTRPTPPKPTSPKDDLDF